MKTNLDQFFKTDSELEKSGLWFDISPKTGFLVRAFKATNPQVKAMTAKYYAPYARQIALGTMPDEEVKKITVQIFINACLVDWKGVEIEGKETEFTPDAAYQLFMELPDLFDTLWNHANDFKNYRIEVGNS